MHLWLLSGLRFNRIPHLRRLLCPLPATKLIEEEKDCFEVLHFDHASLFRIDLSLHIRDIWHYGTGLVSKDLAVDFIRCFPTTSNIFLDFHLDNIQTARDLASYDLRNTWITEKRTWTVANNSDHLLDNMALTLDSLTHFRVPNNRLWT